MAGGKRPEAGRRCGVGDSKPEALVWRKPVLKAEPGEQDSETRPGVMRARCVPRCWLWILLHSPVRGVGWEAISRMGTGSEKTSSLASRGS